MLQLALLSTVVLAAPEAAPEKPRLAILGLTSAGVDAALVESLGDAVTSAASQAGWFKVTSQKDMQTLLGM